MRHQQGSLEITLRGGSTNEAVGSSARVGPRASVSWLLGGHRVEQGRDRDRDPGLLRVKEMWDKGRQVHETVSTERRGPPTRTLKADSRRITWGSVPVPLTSGPKGDAKTTRTKPKNAGP